MADEALLAFSRQGALKTKIRASEITSREHARKLWPFLRPSDEPDNHCPYELVSWISKTFYKDGHSRKAHFRTEHKSGDALQRVFAKAQEDWVASAAESKEHRRAKELIVDELSRRVEAGLQLRWAFNDPTASDFHLEGNLLLGVATVQPEYKLSTPFGLDYRLDIAVLAAPIEDQPPVVLGGIEIEFGHPFEGYKALISKTLGFPLISVDISEMHVDEISEQWAKRVLVDTTNDDAHGRRKTFVYLHDLLYPQYLQLPDDIDKVRRHQYLVFAPDHELFYLCDSLEKLRKKFDIEKKHLNVGRVNGAGSPEALQMVQNAGSSIGPDWSEVNDHQFVRISINKPVGPSDTNMHLFHTAMAKLLLSESDALVGYKYRMKDGDKFPPGDLWLEWQRPGSPNPQRKIAPQRLAAPVSRLMQLLAWCKQ
ncbi:MAG: hypothetical protein K2X29_14870 [Candidatus Obscuribacterales bacterium]|nr:hypothetical protein [Candidatus Obscuribacterales bacterium]